MYMQIFMCVGVSVKDAFQPEEEEAEAEEEEEEDEEHGNSVKISVLHLYYKLFLIFFPDIISFQHVLHLGVGRSQIEWKLKAKTQISVFPWANIGQNDHSNPYIESTTVLSDTPT